MIQCTKCTYAWNPDTATICVQCKAPLDGSGPVRRGDTMIEDAAPPPEPVRRQTLVEGAPFSAPIKPAAPSAPPSRWDDAGAPAPAFPPAPQYPQAPAFPPAAPVYTAPKPPPPVAPPPVAPPPSTATHDTPATNRRTLFADFSTPAAEAPATPAAGQRSGAADATRKIVGILITYSWKQQGQIFPVLEGRNFIGKDPAECDICVPEDATLSSVNSYITYRRNFIIGDRWSMSGTDVDGEPIESEVVSLRNYAKIRTGSTYWTFVAIQPPTEDASRGA